MSTTNDPLFGVSHNSDEWLFEYGIEGESYTGVEFSEVWVGNYLQNTNAVSLYCCLWHNGTEQAVWVYGFADTFIIEAHLVVDGRIGGYVLQIKDKPNLNDVVINNCPAMGKTMNFPGNEVFNSVEALGVLSSFHKDKTIPETVTLSQKSYLFPCN